MGGALIQRCAPRIIWVEIRAGLGMDGDCDDVHRDHDHGCDGDGGGDEDDEDVNDKDDDDVLLVYWDDLTRGI